MPPKSKQHNEISKEEYARLLEQFLERVNKSSGFRPNGDYYKHLNEDCWIWTGGTENSGRGVLQSDLAKKLNIKKAHRLSMYFYKSEEYAWNLDVLHACDNPVCVNPAHLRCGTVAENVKDRDERGRQVAHNGTKNGQAFFKTQQQIDEVIFLRESGLSYQAIATNLGCNRRTVERLLTGKHYGLNEN